MAAVVAGHEPAARPGPARQVTDELSLEAVHMTAQRRAAKWLGPRPHAVTVAPCRPPRYHHRTFMFVLSLLKFLVCIGASTNIIHVCLYSDAIFHIGLYSDWVHLGTLGTRGGELAATIPD